MKKKLTVREAANIVQQCGFTVYEGFGTLPLSPDPDVRKGQLAALKAWSEEVDYRPPKHKPWLSFDEYLVRVLRGEEI